MAEAEIISKIAESAVVFPKAITTTLMFRLFLCDIFIHGTGGASYDKITDEIIKDYFSPDKSCPEFLSATGDIYLPLLY